ncbi:MAG: carbamate kinase [Oscillospiraceae bacterium]|nr:carbamate kinase [Oscillospiraceae bacterium]
MKKIVLALGGNALGNTLKEQKVAVKTAAKAIVDLIEGDLEIVITHGNGPQVGMINLAMETAQKYDDSFYHIPMYTCVAMTQGYIGQDIQNAISEELAARGMSRPVATVVTQTLVDANDPAFDDPTKPIGAFYTEEEAKVLIERGEQLKEDSGRGWRHVVASPLPIDIVESSTVQVLLDAGHVPIAGGGGGIAVTKNSQGHFEGASAVVDKDFVSAKLAEILNADTLIILTAIDYAYQNFEQPNQEAIVKVDVEEAQKYVDEGHFAPGSMLPKVQAAISFAKSAPGRQAIIAKLDHAQDILTGKTGTTVVG